MGGALTGGCSFGAALTLFSQPFGIKEAVDLGRTGGPALAGGLPGCCEDPAEALGPEDAGGPEGTGQGSLEEASATPVEAAAVEGRGLQTGLLGRAAG